MTRPRNVKPKAASVTVRAFEAGLDGSLKARGKNVDALK
jgi:hypothetical protein